MTKANFTHVSNENDLQWKTTSSVMSEIYQQLLVRSSPNIKLKLMWPKQTLQMFQKKMTSNGRRPQIEDYLKCQKRNISANLLMVGSSPNFKLWLMWPKHTLQTFQKKTPSNRRLPQMTKVKYLSNYWSDLPQILKLGLRDQSKLYKFFKEDDLK